MKKRVLRIFILAGISFLVLFSPSAAEINWLAVRTIVDNVRLINQSIETLLAVMAAYPQISPPSQFTYTAVGFSNNAWKVKLTQPTNQYLLEIWANTGASYEKGLEFLFTDANDGVVIARPWVFVNTYNSSLYVRATYHHTSGQRSITIDVLGASSFTKAQTLLTQAGGLVSIYLTALTSDLGGGAANDVYSFAGRVKTASPNYASAKFGLDDQTSPLGFGWYGGVNSLNAARFNNSGFVSDGNAETGDADYPDISDMTAAGLPTIANVAAIDIVFQYPLDPGF